MPSALEAQSLNQWTTREVPQSEEGPLISHQGGLSQFQTQKETFKPIHAPKRDKDMLIVSSGTQNSKLPGSLLSFSSILHVSLSLQGKLLILGKWQARALSNLLISNSEQA